MALVAAFLFGKVQEGCNLYGGVYEALGWHLPVEAGKQGCLKPPKVRQEWAADIPQPTGA